MLRRDYNPATSWPDSSTGGALQFQSRSALPLHLENSHCRLTDHVSQIYSRAKVLAARAA